MQVQSRKYTFRKGVKKCLLKVFKDYGVPVDYKLFAHWAFNSNLFIVNDFLNSKGALDAYYANLLTANKEMPAEFFRAKILEESVVFFFLAFAWNDTLQGFRWWKEIFGVLYPDYHIDISPLIQLYGNKQS